MKGWLLDSLGLLGRAKETFRIIIVIRKKIVGGALASYRAIGRGRVGFIQEGKAFLKARICLWWRKDWLGLGL